MHDRVLLREVKVALSNTIVPLRLGVIVPLRLGVVVPFLRSGIVVVYINVLVPGRPLTFRLLLYRLLRLLLLGLLLLGLLRPLLRRLLRLLGGLLR